MCIALTKFQLWFWVYYYINLFHSRHTPLERNIILIPFWGMKELGTKILSNLFKVT